MVTMCLRSRRLISSTNAASVVVLPMPVAPPMSTRPRGMRDSASTPVGRFSPASRGGCGRQHADGGGGAAPLAMEVDAEPADAGAQARVHGGAALEGAHAHAAAARRSPPARCRRRRAAPRRRAASSAPSMRAAGGAPATSSRSVAPSRRTSASHCSRRGDAVGARRQALGLAERVQLVDRVGRSRRTSTVAVSAKLQRSCARWHEIGAIGARPHHQEW